MNIVTPAGFSGVINLQVHDKNGIKTLDQNQHNDIDDTTRDDLLDAIFDGGTGAGASGYDWVGSDLNNRLAFYSNTNTYHAASSITGNPGTNPASEDGKSAITISTGAGYTGNTAFLAMSSAVVAASNDPSAGSATLTGSGTITGLTATFSSANFGVIQSWAYASNGSETWRSKWATGNFSSTVTLGTSDTLTVTWVITISN